VPIRVDGDDSPITGVIGVTRDVTETMLARKQLEYMAHHDVLTGLPNRALLNDRMTEAVNRAKRHHKKFAVLFVDLDRFKQVNDTLGHQAGDRLIQWVATRCNACVRDVDTVSRLGGDEFAILLEDLTSAHGAAVVAQRLLDALKGPYHDGGRLIATGGSVGISLYPDDGLDTETLLKSADNAMYRAKERGRGGFEFFSRDLGEASAAIFTKTNWLREALEARDFVLHYQPTVDLRARRVNGVEALIRMRKPDGALMPPLEFIALAEETGLIIPIGEWVIEEACRQIKAWDALGHSHLRMAINLSAKQFQDRKFVQKFADSLGSRGVKPSRIMVEVTESMMFPDPQLARSVFAELKDMRVAVAIDDFGTGYSSLAYLKDFPVDFVKIDRTFIAGVPHDQKACGITRTIAVMSHNLQLGVIAEGVETEVQYAFLRELDCDEAQGFYLCHPLDAKALTERLTEGLSLP
jgi:diguanylate cyclase (GGDEF)-like protein